MDQHKLYRTIKELGERRFRTDEQLLAHVLRSIIRKEEIPIRGGRIWMLEPETATYRVVRQYGEMTPIAKDFRLRVSDYPPFQQLHRKGTLFAKETSRYLRRRGIKLYSATGVGEKVAWKNQFLFQYVIGINADFLKDDMRYALNIIGNALTTALRNRRIESKARLLEADLDKAYAIQKSILPEHEMRFHHYDMYILKGSFVVAHIWYYDANGKKYRTYTVEKWDRDKTHGYPTIERAKMADTEIGGHTVLEYKDVKYNLGLPESLFTERFLKRTPYKFLK